MIRQPLVLLLVAFELLFGTPFHATVNLFRRTIHILIEPLDNEKISRMQNILRVHGIAGTLTERKEIDCIQQVGLTHAILSEKAVELRRESKIYLFQILVIEYRNAVQYHNQCEITMQKYNKIPLFYASGKKSIV